MTRMLDMAHAADATTDNFAGDWRLLAACDNTDPELFFPVGEVSSASKEQIEQAKAVCAGCPVRAQCLAEALANSDTHGIWGGMTESERRGLRHSS